MRVRSAAAVWLLGLGACSGGEQADDGQFNDTATGVMLMREHPLSRDPAQRVERLAQCSGILIKAASLTPPPPRAERMIEQSERMHRLAVQLGATTGRTEAEVTRIRDEAVAATRQLSENLPGEFPGLLERATNACGMGEIMTDQELTGLSNSATTNVVAPPATN